MRMPKAKVWREPKLWPRSLLETMLYAERRDLLFAYFGIPMALDSRVRERSLKRNIYLKRRIIWDLTQPMADLDTSMYQPYKRFISSDAIIPSIDGSLYPSADDSGFGISTWFKLEFFDLYHNGIEFILSIEYAVHDERDIRQSPRVTSNQTLQSVEKSRFGISAAFYSATLLR